SSRARRGGAANDRLRRHAVDPCPRRRHRGDRGGRAGAPVEARDLARRRREPDRTPRLGRRAVLALPTRPAAAGGRTGGPGGPLRRSRSRAAIDGCKAMSGRIIVLGAAGRIGRAAAEAFRNAGWTVASLVRASAAARAAPRTEIVEVDARDAGTVVEASRGSDVILHALNPPYTEWPKYALPHAEAAIAAARASGATLLFPGNVYNYGPPMPAVIDETTPMHPRTRKGRLRVEIERRMQDATDIRVIILRAGDFFGGAGLGSWFDRVIV